MAGEERKKRSHTGRNVAGGAAVVVLLAALLGGGRLGFGKGGDSGVLPETGNSTQSESAQAAQAEASQAPEETPQAPGELEIVVRENTILYRGEETDLAGLEEALLRDYAEGVKVTLTDDHAIKAAFDEVSALLDTLGIPIS